MDWSNLIFGIIATLSLLGGFVTARSGAARDLVEAATGLVGPLQDRIAALERKVACLEKETTALEMWGRHLAQQVRELGGVPIPFDEFLRAVERGETSPTSRR